MKPTFFAAFPLPVPPSPKPSDQLASWKNSVIIESAIVGEGEGGRGWGDRQHLLSWIINVVGQGGKYFTQFWNIGYWES